MALARALADDPDVVVFGEDVGSTAAVFARPLD
jgi:pyruvate/2-oxoglutarate/acetoin dehydrogenase E1 component